MITERLHTTYFLEYVEENYENFYNPIAIKEFNIYYCRDNVLKDEKLLYSKNKIINNTDKGTAVFNIQGFLDVNTYLLLKKEKFVRITLIYAQDGNTIEKSMYYKIKKNNNGLVLKRAGSVTLTHVLMLNVKAILFLKYLEETNSKLLLKNLNGQVSVTRKSVCQKIFNEYIENTANFNINAKKLFISLYHLALNIQNNNNMAYREFSIPQNLRVLYTINSFFSDGLGASSNIKINKIPWKLRSDLSIYNFIPHTFKIDKKTALLTKYTNFYNLNPNKFKGVLKTFISKDSYKTFKNIILFPFIQNEETVTQKV